MRGFVATITILLVTMEAWVTVSKAQSNEQSRLALARFQRDAPACIAYHRIMEECLRKSDPDAAGEHAVLAESQFQLAIQVGRGAGTMESQIVSHIATADRQMRQQMADQCANIASLQTRYAARCKQAIEDGGLVLRTQLRQER